MNVRRKIIEIDEDLCNGCGNCIITCAEGALHLVDGKAKLVSDVYCDGLGACLGECPTGALRIVEREAADFDEEAVEHRLATLKEAEVPAVEASMPCGCPGTRLQIFDRPQVGSPAGEPLAEALRAYGAPSALSHWPVQIRLVPPTAPFLRNADLLVAADCTPFAYANFHKDFLQGKVVMVGCPKLDDAQHYLEKFTEIFKTADISSLTIVFMEVPCCHGLPMIVKRASELSGKSIRTEHITIGVGGDILNREKMAA